MKYASDFRQIARDALRGNKWRLFCLLFSFIGWSLLVCGISFALFFVGQLFLCPYQNAALAAFYRDISAGYDRTAPVLPGEICDGEVTAHAAFCVLSVRILRRLFAVAPTQNMATLAELARLYSSEIEYSPENTDALLALCRE